MSVLTDALWDQVGFTPNFFALDNQSAVTTTTSNLTGATPRILSLANRYTVVPTTATVVLPSLLTGETNGPIIVINAGVNALTVYAYADVGGHAEKINNTASTFGGATGGLSIAAGSAAQFIAEDVPKGRGGVATANNLNWSAAVLS